MTLKSHIWAAAGDGQREQARRNSDRSTVHQEDTMKLLVLLAVAGRVALFIAAPIGNPQALGRSVLVSEGPDTYTESKPIESHTGSKEHAVYLSPDERSRTVVSS